MGLADRLFKYAPSPEGAIVSLSHRAACFLLIAAAAFSPGQTTTPMPRSEDAKLLAERNALLAEVERLNKELQPAPVSSWRVTGKVKGNVVELKIVFSFVTTRDRAVVSLGCTRSQNVAVSLDGKLAPLLNLDGLVLDVESAGKHEAVVESLMALREMIPSGTPRPSLTAEPLQGFDLDLPKTPVTAVDIELPAGLKNLEINGKQLDDTMTLTNNRLSGPLGAVQQLKLVWKTGQALSAPQAVLTASGKIVVNLTERDGSVVTEATLTLQDLGRVARDWLLQVPDRSQVRLLNADDRTRLRGEIQGSDSPDGRITIPLVAASDQPLSVVITVRRPRGSGSIPLGPFAVVGAANQNGTVTVRADPDKRVLCKPFRANPAAFTVTPIRPEARGKAETRPDDVSPAFQYLTQPGVARPDVREPWFKLDLDSIQGQLDTSVQHTIKLGPAGPADWRLTTILEVAPLRAEVERMELTWPAPWRLDRELGPRVTGATLQGIKDDTANRSLQLDLGSETLKPFKVKLEALAAESEVRGGEIAPAMDVSASALFKLPRPRSASVRDGGKHLIELNAPGETIDLRVLQPANPGLELVEQQAHRIVWRADRFVSQVAVSWKPYRAEVSADNVIDCTIAGSEVRVEHVCNLGFEESSRLPDSVLLRVPAEVKWLRRVLDSKKEEDLLGGSEMSIRRVGTDRLIRCPITAVRIGPGATGRLILKYGTILRAAKNGEEPLKREATVPLVAVVEATQTKARLRVWAEPGSRVRSLGGSWEEQALEIVPERDSLPSLVVSSQQPLQPVSLRVEASPARAGIPPILLDRALFQVRVNENGIQNYRLRFLVRQISGSHLDLAVPAQPAGIGLEILLDGVKVNWEAIDNAHGSASADPFVVRLSLPRQMPARPAVLEVVYQLLPGQGGLGISLQSVLQPVTIPGLLTGLPVRWQVELPPDRVVLPLDGDASWRWGRRGWLLAPRPSVNNADLERWFAGEGEARTTLSEDEGAMTVSHVCWRTSLTPLTLVHVPQQGWLLICSPLVLIIGLALGQAAFRASNPEGKRGWLLWVLLTLPVLALAGVGLIWPGLLTVMVYGAQPGLAVLLVVLAVQWVLHERYRRRVVFLPGFRRVKTGSSLARAGRPEGAAVPAVEATEGKAPSSNPTRRAPRAEPSTVDAPLPPPT
jgi:hypothetical protein